MARLNPNYYRLAAERILAGKDWCSCHAIQSSICKSRKQQFYKLVPTVAAHQDAYETMFASFNKKGRRINTNRHPFWNKEATPERQQIRAQALLMMAEIVESGRENYYEDRWEVLSYSQRWEVDNNKEGV